MTPTTLRDHYGSDDFGGLSDALLERAIERARSTILRYLPREPVSAEDSAKINDVWLTLARAYAYDDQALKSDHPVVRELNEVMAWLKQIGTGSIRFGTSTGSAGAPQVAAPDAVFGTEFAGRQVS